jgi:hypothetical protein
MKESDYFRRERERKEDTSPEKTDPEVEALTNPVVAEDAAWLV